MILFDAHFHLEGLICEQLGLSIEDALARGVCGGISAGIWSDTLSKILLFKDFYLEKCSLQVMSKNDEISFDCKRFLVFPAHGMHPFEIHKRWFAENGDADIEKMDFDIANFFEKLELGREFIWAIGEAGFDFSKDVLAFCKNNLISKRDIFETQKKAFEACCLAAKRLDVPLIIHSRAAWKATIDLLTEQECFSIPILFHCYSGSSHELLKLSKNKNIYFSFGSSVTWPNSHKLREVVKTCPRDNILTETDAPYMKPMALNFEQASRQNYPGEIKAITEYLSKIRGENSEYFSENTLNNFCRLLKINPS